MINLLIGDKVLNYKLALVIMILLRFTHLDDSVDHFSAAMEWSNFLSLGLKKREGRKNTY
jgi:hypothetical protein